MTTNIITKLTDPQGFSLDLLTNLLRYGAQRLIEQPVNTSILFVMPPRERPMAWHKIPLFYTDLNGGP
jgi:hypothetical protein